MNKNPTMISTLVSVRFFEDGRELTYYNDRFLLEPGDVVFVSGRYAGKAGEVVKVSTRFRISLADYQRVISRADREIHGTYEHMLDKMISFSSEAFTPEQFRSWILPPAEGGEEEEEIVFGEGYELDLEAIEDSEDADAAVLQRANEYCLNGNVTYISVKNGIGRAFVRGTDWYELDFTLKGNRMAGMYCGCPYPGLCKHLLAVALTVRDLSREDESFLRRDFVAMDAERFWSIAARTQQFISL